MSSTSLRRLATSSFLALLTALAASLPARADGSLAAVEEEFRQAIRRVTPATVLCRPWGVTGNAAGLSSGVIVAPEGIVLSDGDAGLRWRRRGRVTTREWLDDVEVRVPDAGRGGSTPYRARVLNRDRVTDTALLRILEPPAEGFPHVPPGRSDALRVGRFTFALGSAFDEQGRVPPTLTAGVVAGFDRLPPGDVRGRYATVYTAAAVNPGVNGGPLVDVHGRLVATISTYLDPEPDEPFQFLAKAIPFERILHAHAGVPEAVRLLGGAEHAAARTREAEALETVFRDGALAAWPVVVSLEVSRARPVSRRVPLENRAIDLPRYEGPVSGILLSSDGWVVTSLYNLTNVAALASPLWRASPGAGVDEGLADVRGVTVHLADGRRAGARLVGHDPRLGVALLKADLGDVGGGPPPPRPAPASAFQRGRFVLALGNPFGASRPEEPLLTVGILSKEHPDDAAAAWRGQWQTDAAGLDTNAGGAAVDLEGRILGMLNLWRPAQHGRASGIAFVVPWERIEAALPRLKADERPRRGLLGVRFRSGGLPVVGEVVAGSGAERAGLRPGDLIRRVDREEVITAADVVAVLSFRYEGETVRVVLEREGALQSVQATLGPR